MAQGPMVEEVEIRMNDGVVYEKSHTGKIRAVVMRQGVQMKSKWSGTKEGALRSLVVSLSTIWAATDDAFNAVCDEHDKEQLTLAEDHRPIIADILDGLGGDILRDGAAAVWHTVNGKDIIAMEYEAYFRGASVLRWSARREAR